MDPLLQVVARAIKRGGVFLIGTTLPSAAPPCWCRPGPGIAVMLLGLVVLSAEFKWAQRILTWSRERGRLKHQAQARMPGANRRPPSDPPTRGRPDRAA